MSLAASLIRLEFSTLPHTRRSIKAEGRWFGPFASSLASKTKGHDTVVSILLPVSCEAFIFWYCQLPRHSEVH